MKEGYTLKLVWKKMTGENLIETISNFAIAFFIMIVGIDVVPRLSPVIVLPFTLSVLLSSIYFLTYAVSDLIPEVVKQGEKVK